MAIKKELIFALPYKDKNRRSEIKFFARLKPTTLKSIVEELKRQYNESITNGSEEKN